MSRFFLHITLALALLLGLMTACGDDDDSSDDDGADDDATDDDADDDTTTDDDADDDVDDDVDDDSDDDADDDTDDGTWTDTISGLTWTVSPAFGPQTRGNARSYCEDLETDGGGWRLPAISELRTLIRGCDGTVTGGSCGVTDACMELACQDESCYDCNEDEGPHDGCYGPAELSGDCGWYWSASDVSDSVSDLAWGVDFSQGKVVFDSIFNSVRARCVR